MHFLSLARAAFSRLPLGSISRLAPLPLIPGLDKAVSTGVDGLHAHVFVLVCLGFTSFFMLMVHDCFICCTRVRRPLQEGQEALHNPYRDYHAWLQKHESEFFSGWMPVWVVSSFRMRNKRVLDVNLTASTITMKRFACSRGSAYIPIFERIIYQSIGFNTNVWLGLQLDLLSAPYRLIFLIIFLEQSPWFIPYVINCWDSRYQQFCGIIMVSMRSVIQFTFVSVSVFFFYLAIIHIHKQTLSLSHPACDCLLDASNIPRHSSSHTHAHTHSHTYAHPCGRLMSMYNWRRP